MQQACPAEPDPPPRRAAAWQPPSRYTSRARSGGEDPRAVPGAGPRRGRGVPPRRVPDVGQVLRLGPQDMRYRAAPLTIRVREVRLDLSIYYDGDWVWVEGEELEPGGIVVGWRQGLVRVDAIPT